MKRKVLLLSLLVATVFLMAQLLKVAGILPSFNSSKPDSSQKEKVLEAYGKLPLYFIKNEGQLDEKVKYYEKGLGHAVYFTEDGIHISLTRYKEDKKKGKEFVAISDRTKRPEFETRTVKLYFLDSNPKPELVAEGELEGKVNYFVGNDPKKWKSNIPTYKSVWYKELYKGIDVRFYGNQRQLEYDIIVKPGADPYQVKLVYEGIEGLKITDEGNLEVFLDDGSFIVQHKPVVYQEIEGKRVEIAGDFVIVKEDKDQKRAVYAFKVSDYDRTKPLIIDPVLSYSTYLGGSDEDEGWGIAVDSSGNAYVTGWTYSTDFPTTADAYQSTFNGWTDAFVVKLSASGDNLVYSTYLGGSYEDEGFGIAVDSSGNAYVTGRTYSTDFPTTADAYDRTYNGGYYDAFVVKLSASGDNLVYSTYLGGNDWDIGFGIAVDSSGNAYVTGWTRSTNFPTTPNAYQSTYNYGGDAFVVKFDLGGSGGGGDSGSGGGGGDSGSGGGGGGCSLGSGASPVNALAWLIVPVFILARRIRNK